MSTKDRKAESASMPTRKKSAIQSEQKLEQNTRQLSPMIYFFLGMAIAFCVCIVLGIISYQFFLKEYGDASAYGNLKRLQLYDAVEGVVDSAEIDREKTKWTCAMHPSILRDDDSDKCPLCNMALVRVKAQRQSKNKDSKSTRNLAVDEFRLEKGNVRSERIRRRRAFRTVKLIGRLTWDESKIREIEAPFSGRVRELYLNYIGMRVNIGETIAKIKYSETGSFKSQSDLRDIEIQSPHAGILIKKYLVEGDLAKEGWPMFELVDDSELWLMLEAFENDLQVLRYGQDLSFTVAALANEKFSARIAFIYPMLNRNKQSFTLRARVPNPDGRLRAGYFASAFVKVELNARGQVIAPHLTGKFISPSEPYYLSNKPGKCIYSGADLVSTAKLAYAKAPLNDEELPIVIPSSAVLPAKNGGVIFLEDENGQAAADADKIFQSITLKTNQACKYYEDNKEKLEHNAESRALQNNTFTNNKKAKSGYIIDLPELVGRKVVVNGAFQLDADMQLSGKISLVDHDVIIAEESELTLAPSEVLSRNHSNNNSKSPNLAPTPKVLQAGEMVEMAEIILPPEQWSKLLTAYLLLQKHLAADDFKKALRQAKILRNFGNESQNAKLLAICQKLGEVKNIEELRVAFEPLSILFIKFVKQLGLPKGMEIIRISHCPMAFEFKGADWLQTDEKIFNPYFGSQMLHCGSHEEIIKKN